MDEDKAISVLEEIMADTERDITEAEGQILTGRLVADFNGKQNAMIKTLASVLREVIITNLPRPPK